MSGLGHMNYMKLIVSTHTIERQKLCQGVTHHHRMDPAISEFAEKKVWSIGFIYTVVCFTEFQVLGKKKKNVYTIGFHIGIKVSVVGSACKFFKNIIPKEAPLTEREGAQALSEMWITSFHLERLIHLDCRGHWIYMLVDDLDTVALEPPFLRDAG